MLATRHVFFIRPRLRFIENCAAFGGAFHLDWMRVIQLIAQQMQRGGRVLTAATLSDWADGRPYDRGRRKKREVQRGLAEAAGSDRNARPALVRKEHRRMAGHRMPAPVDLHQRSEELILSSAVAPGQSTSSPSAFSGRATVFRCSCISDASGSTNSKPVTISPIA